jgi:cysteine desulfurase/selenocysteine lyase
MDHQSDTTTKSLDIQAIREQFPILHQEVNGHPLVYFDNAATTQKPKVVIDAITDYYSGYNANIHRGIHTLAEKATKAFEDTRIIVQKFINAAEPEEIIFTKGTTDGINLVASSYGRTFLKEGDEVIVSHMEHHSNTVPWQILCEEKGAKLRVIPIDENGEVKMDEFLDLLNEKTKIVSMVHASNSLGTINPIERIIAESHKVGAIVVVDAAQATAHLDIDVQKLDVDFYSFSGHKVYAPTGTGVLYGKRELLEKMPPYQGGGEMIKEVTMEKTTYNDIPYKFEAGTPNIADIIAFKYALEFVNEIGKPAIRAHEDQLLQYAHEQLSTIDGLRIIGKADHKVSVVSFVIEGVHHFDVGQLLDARGIAVRTGHHCTQPLMDRYGIEGTIRASFSIYNTKEEIDRLVEGLKRIVKMLK